MKERADSKRYEANLTAGRVVLRSLALGVCALGVLTALGLAAAVTGSSQADAAGWLKSGSQGVLGHRGDRDDDRHESFGLHAEFAVEWILHRVDATEEQTEKIKQIVGASMQDLHAEGGTREDHRAEIMALLSGDTVDRDALEAYRQEQLARMDSMTSKLADALVAISAELTLEQRKELVAMAERHHGPRGSRWHH